MKKITRKYFENLLSQKDWGKKGSDEREVALILLCSGTIGAFPKKIKKILGDPNDILKMTTKNAILNKIWNKNGEVQVEWLNKKTGSVSLACDIAVCLGWIKRCK